MQDKDAVPETPESKSREQKALARLERLRVHVALPLLILVMLTLTSASRKSATYDEPAILTASIHYVRSFDPALNAENPPLLKALWALPTLLIPRVEDPDPPPSLRYSYDLADLTQFSRQYLFRHPDHGAILFAARCMNILLAAMLGVAVYGAACRTWDRRTGLAALWIYALSPNLIAHARLVTPDLGCAGLVFVSTATLAATIRRSTPTRIVVAGLALGPRC